MEESKDMLLGQLKAHHLEINRRMDRFEDTTKEDFDAINKRFDDLETKIDSLQKFKWQVMGVCLFLSTLIAVFVK